MLAEFAEPRKKPLKVLHIQIHALRQIAFLEKAQQRMGGKK